jgi:hypothetical protein
MKKAHVAKRLTDLRKYIEEKVSKSRSRNTTALLVIHDELGSLLIEFQKQPKRKAK